MLDARFLLVCLGGAVGTAARYALAVSMPRPSESAFPLGTFAVNVAGSFLIGALMALAADETRVPPTVRIALGVGVLGGFTTFSSFSLESVRLLQGGAALLGLAYVAASVIACLAACAGGLALGRLVAS